MPFDNATYTESKTFNDLGLIPLTDRRVSAWRKKVVDEFRRRGSIEETALTSGRARWMKIGTFPIKNFGKSRLCGSAAPKDVKRLINQIAVALPTATCTVEHFDRDPIVHVHDCGNQYCVAIWDRKVVRAIAGNARLSWHQKLLRRLVAIA